MLCPIDWLTSSADSLTLSADSPAAPADSLASPADSPAAPTDSLVTVRPASVSAIALHKAARLLASIRHDSPSRWLPLPADSSF